MSVRLNTSFVGEAADAAKLSAIQPEITAAHEKLHNGTGEGNAFLGWVTFRSTMIRRSSPE